MKFVFARFTNFPAYRRSLYLELSTSRSWFRVLVIVPVAITSTVERPRKTNFFMVLRFSDQLRNRISKQTNLRVAQITHMSNVARATLRINIIVEWQTDEAIMIRILDTEVTCRPIGKIMQRGGDGKTPLERVSRELRIIVNISMSQLYFVLFLRSILFSNKFFFFFSKLY